MRLPIVDQISSAPPVQATGPRSIAAVKMLRISVTDRCNFRCTYCMPETGVAWLPKDHLLSFEEICDVVRASVDIHGITRFKLTGGEPTVRAGLTDLMRMLRKIRGIEDLSMTTNGFRLVDLARPLKESGLDRVTISIDSLREDRFRRITRTGDLNQVLRGLDVAEDAGLLPLKINCVAMRGVNDDEFADFARLTLNRAITVRFIEYMPLGDAAIRTTRDTASQAVHSAPHGLRARVTTSQDQPDAARSAAARMRRTTGFQPVSENQHGLEARATHRDTASQAVPNTQHGLRARVTISADETGPAGGCGAQDRGDAFISESEIRERITRELDELEPLDGDSESGVGPAKIFKLKTANPRGRIGFISAMSAPFCSTCNRLRLTAHGVLRSCLFEGGEVPIRDLIRATTSSHRRAGLIADAMAQCVRLKPEIHSSHGSEQMSRIGG